MSDWTPVVDLVEKLNALAMDWDKVADRRACAGELRDVLSGQYDPRHQLMRDAEPNPPSCCEHHSNRSNGLPCGGACCQDCPALGGEGRRGAGMSDCIFCAEIAAADNRVAAADTTYLRRDLYPAAEGHMEVVPLRHVASFFELTDGEVADIVALLHRARDLTPADGYTIGVNEGRAAGRTVDHLHIHLIPRQHGDVTDPRGGVRNVLSSAPHPSTWQTTTVTGSYVGEGGGAR